MDTVKEFVFTHLRCCVSTMYGFKSQCGLITGVHSNVMLQQLLSSYSYSTKATHDHVILLHVFPYSVVAGYLRIVLLVI